MEQELDRTDWMLCRAEGPSPADHHTSLLRHVGENLDKRERALGIAPGQPFLLRPDGSPDRDVLRYFNSPTFRRLALQSQLSYAYDLKVHLSFLETQDVNWRNATEEHLQDYEYWRRRAPDNPRRVGGSKFGRELAACRRFYEWASHRGLIDRSPVELESVWRPDGTVVDALRLRPSNARSQRVKWLLPEAYRLWRNVGLGGYTKDGERDESWRGRNDGRNLAFASTLWATGLRLREGGTLLLMELPTIAPEQPPLRGRLGEAVAKGSGRDYWISPEAVQAIEVTSRKVV